VDLAVCHTLTFNCRALCAKKFIFFKLNCLLLACYTVHHPSEIGFFALEAGEVRHFEQSKSLKLAKEVIVRVF
jgi:hypothetical protein